MTSCRRAWILCICLSWFLLDEILPSHQEVFTAMSDLHEALRTGQELASDLHAYADIEESRLSRIRQLADHLANLTYPSQFYNTVEDYKEYLSKDGQEEVLIANPISAYLTLKKLARDWRSELLNLVQRESNGITMDSSKNYNEEELGAQGAPYPSRIVVERISEKANMLPGHEDLLGAADAVLRLQTTYKLSSIDLSEGRLVPGVSNQPLSAAQCYHLGSHAYNQRDYLHAEEWFHAAYLRLKAELKEKESSEDPRVLKSASNFEDDEEETPTMEEILDHWAYSFGRQGRYQEALNITKMQLAENPMNQKAAENLEFYEHRLSLGEGIFGPLHKDIESLTPHDREVEVFEGTCRGEDMLPPPKDSSVYCRFYRPHPFYTLGPVREEIVYPDPRIVIWHDIVSMEEIDQIKELAKPRFNRATVKNPITGKLEFANYRISKSAWLKRELSPVTETINKRIEMMTRLSLETAEDLQVSNYGIGGHYAPHFDFGRKREKDAFEIRNGNRIATLIFYLSDVTAGGATAFTRIGARVWPQIQSAAFWWNLLPNGDGDLKTRHAACPVVAGSKWVMNLWFHERGQEFIRRCELEQGRTEGIDDF